MKYLLTTIYLILCAIASITLGVAGMKAVALNSFFVLGVLFLIWNKSEKNLQLMYIFGGALLARMMLAIFAFAFDFQEYLASDYLVYDLRGYVLSEYVFGNDLTDESSRWYLFSHESVGVGMYHFVAAIYLIIGRNPLAASLICGTIGAATSPLIYALCLSLFNNRRVAVLSSVFVAFFPAFIVWSSFLLKDGLIVFSIALAFYSVSKLQAKFEFSKVLLLIGCLVSVAGLRFYVFPMAAIACIGGILIGKNQSIAMMTSRLAALVILVVSLSYFGITGYVQQGIDRYGTLDSLQASKSDLATSADSGFGRELDVSTAEGVVSALPIGVLYLTFAPFPWEITSLRAGLTLPDALLWWFCVPFMLYGLYWVVKNRFRECFSVIAFSLILLVFYSIFQGNVGTAYRQRTQIQVFGFMFVSVGIVLINELRENRRIRESDSRRKQLKSI